MPSIPNSAAAADAVAMQRISQRLLQLPAGKRAQFGQALAAKGLSLADLPIVARHDAAKNPDAPLAPAQQRLWFLDQFQGASPAYNICAALQLEGPLDVAALKTAFEHLLQRHATLRTAIVSVDGKAAQRVVEGLVLPWEPVDLSASSADVREAELQRIAIAAARTPFDLAQPPLMRASLARIGERSHRLWLTLHHIAADGWSMGVLVEELGALYRALSVGGSPALPPLPLTFADCAAWHQEVLQAQGVFDAQLRHWQGEFGDEHPVLNLPGDRPRPAQPSLRGAVHAHALPERLSGALRALCRAQGRTPFVLMLAAYQLLLWRLSGQPEVRVGTPVANRERREIQGLVGMFANTVVLRATPRADESFVDLLALASQRVAAAQAHQDLPFEQLVDALKVPRELSHSPLFQTMLVFNAPAVALHLGPVVAKPVPTPRDSAKFDLTLEVTDEPDGGLLLEWVYATDLFDAASVARIARRFERLLQSIAERPDARLDALPWLEAEEAGWLARDWNATRLDREHHGWVHELIARQAGRTPDAPALYADGQCLSYRELDTRANRLAHWLRSRGVRPDDVVGVCLQRSVEMVVALLGTMKAGAAYLPLDPDYPQDRLDYMARDASLRCLLSRSGTPRLPRGDGLHPVMLDAVWDEIARQPASAPRTSVHGASLAYVIYTSGSTGQPKGVAVPHAGLLNRLQWMQEAYGLRAGDRVLQKTPFSFDVSVWEFFWPLMTGAVLAMAAPGAHRDSERLVGAILEFGITTLHFVPSMLRAFLDDADAAGCHSIRRVICSGEALPFDLQQRCHAVLGAELYNLYGPTEASIDVSHWHCPRDAVEPVVPIGRPIANTTLHVLDAALRPVPVGVAGELYLGGVGLARAYLGQPALTAEKFVPDVFAAEPGARLYRTGDLARWRLGGSVEYLGRLDHQVKIRGFRIELGEIESRLLSHPDVADAVVVAREDRPGDKRLAAYWVGRTDVAADDAPRRFLAETLPEHMLPSAWVRLAAMPLSPNGKLDRKQLPAPQAVATSDARRTPPRNAAEQVLAEVWQAVLGLDAVGVHDNFFRLGGDSILSLQVVARARQRGLRLKPRQMFEHQTIAQLAPVAQRDAMPADSAMVLPDEWPLTPIQHWFFDAAFEHPSHWNQALVLRLNERLSPSVVEDALKAVVAQHAALRLRFNQINQTRIQTRTQRAAPAATATVQSVDLSQLREDLIAQTIAEQGGALQRGLDLESGPLMVAALFDLGPQRPQRLLLAAHHLAIDGVSWRVLVDDLATACRQRRQARAIELPPATTSYGEWAVRLAEHARSDITLAELPYWQLASDAEPLFGAISPGQLGQVHRLRQQLDAERSRRLLGDAPARLRANVEDLLLTALAQTLCAWKQRPAIRIELEGHGREDLFDGVDLSRTVGWFTCRYPVRLAVGGQALADLKAVKEQLRTVPRRGVGHGLLREQLAGRAAPQVCFNYLGRFGTAFNAHGLFALADESPGATRRAGERRTHLLEVDAQATGDTLAIDWQLDPRLADGAAFDALTQDFLRRLETLIDALSDVAACATPSDFPLAGLSQAELDALPLDWATVQDLYPLTPMQNGLLAQTQLAPEAGTYWLQEQYRLEGEVDAPAFAQAWSRVIERHPALRTSLVSTADASALQVVWTALPGMVESLDWRDLDAAEQARALDAMLSAERAQSDLTRAPLARFRLLRTGERSHLFVLSCHHLLLDAWSFSLLVGDFVSAYAGAAAQAASPPFSRFVAWLAAQGADDARRYWRARLADFDERTPLPLPAATSGRDAMPCDQHLLLGADETLAIQRAAQAHGLTPNTLAQGAWAWLLSSLSGRFDVLFGMTVAGRPDELEGADRIVGLFINTLPLRVAVRPEQAVSDWLQSLQSAAADARQHQHLPLWDVQACSGLGAGEPLFDSLLVFENTPVDDALSAQPLPFSFHREAGRSHTHYPLTLAVSPGARWRLELSANPSRLSPVLLPVLLASFKETLLALAKGMSRPLGRLALGQPGAAMVVPEAATGTVSELIHRACARWPDRTALAVAGRQLDITYGELAMRIDAVAAGLSALGLPPEARVGLCMPRSTELVTALLGVLRAHGAFVVLDPSWPQDRLRLMAEDAGLHVVLADAERAALAARIAPHARVVTHLAAAGHADRQTNWQAPHADRLAYLIYTSGSTGRPKAVAVSHGALATHAQVMARAFALVPDDRVLQFNTLAFDASLDQLLPPLLSGAQVVLRGEAAWDATELHRQLASHRITVADLPTSYWLQMLREWPAGQGASCPSLRLLSVGGEALPADALATWRGAGFIGARLINAYGPTEATITATLQVCDGLAAVDAAQAALPIGHALPGRALHVLDAHLQPVPEGLVGELYIGGPLLARGYHGQAGLTAERFVPDPFGAPGARLYRSGDRVGRLPDGALAYHGRGDRQLKLRGHRIELGEIEACLRALPGVRDAAVTLRDDGVGPRLVAYLTGEVPSGEEALRGLVARRLPEAMRPSDWVTLPALPLTPSGKLDRAALPAPSRLALAEGDEPRTPAERRIAAVWAALLKRPPRVADHFFRSGGDSILALQLVGRLRREGLLLSPKDVFEYPTLEQLARAAREHAGAASHEVPAGEVPLTPIQHWLLAQDLPRPQHWNQSLLLRATGPLEASALAVALQALVDHHDALRLCFERDARGRWRQAYRDALALPWQQSQVEHGELAAACSRVQASLNLSQAPLAAALIDVAGHGQRLLLAVHHLVVDGVSWRVLLEDLNAAYRQALSGQRPQLPPRTSSYLAWSRQIAAYARSGAAEAELARWQSLPRVDFPALERAAPALNVNGAVRCTEVALDEAATRQLLADVHGAYRTEINDLLLCSLGQALCRFAGQPQVLVELEGHGRELLPGMDEALDLGRTVGWFTSRFPVALSALADPGQALAQTKEMLRGVPHKGAGFGALEFLAPPALQAAVRALPRPRVSFNYLGQLDSFAGDASSTPASSTQALAPAFESAGVGVAADNPRSHWIEIDAAVRGGRLCLDWRYSPGHHTAEQVERMAAHQLTSLRALVAHCLAAPAGATPSDFPLASLQPAELAALPLHRVADIYPLSPMQQGMLFHAVCQPQDDVYLNQLHCVVRGEFDVEAFHAAWRQAISRHEVLRTSFIAQREGEGEPLQIVWRDAALPLIGHDWRHREPAAFEQSVQALLAEDRRQGLDLAQAPAMRLQVLHGPAGRTELVWTCHHLLLDGWSSSRLVNEVLARYAAIRTGRALSWPAVRPYRDYIAWTRQVDASAAEAHWRGTLAGLSAPLLLADAIADDGERGGGMSEHTAMLAAADTRALDEAARRAGLTPVAVVQAAWAWLLSRHTGRADVVFGLTVAGRPAELPGCEDTVGLFINTLPVVCALDAGQGVAALATALQARPRPFETTPLADIQRWAFGGAQPLFDTLLVFDNHSPQGAPDAGGLSLDVARRVDRTSYPLTVNVALGERLAVEFSHDCAAFSAAQAARLAEQLLGLLRQFAAGRPPVLVTDAEAARFRAWNDTGDGAGLPADLYGCFLAQAQRTPDALAARCGRARITYRELQARAEAAGTALVAQGVGTDDVVALCDPRGLDLLVMMLAVHYAGGACLPLDPGHPAQRLRQVLAVSGARRVLCGRQAGPAVEQALATLPDVRRLSLDRPHEATASRRPMAHPRGLGYVIYTSGSTGVPKGAMVERLGMMNNLLQKHAQLGLGPRDVVAQTAPATFDISVWQFLSALLCGAAVEIVPDEVVRDPAALWGLVAERGVTVLEAVPSLIHAMLAEPVARMLPLRWLLPTGEALPPALANQWLAAYPQVPLLNVYGPAECADDVSLHPIATPLAAACAHAPIGRPVANLRLHVLSEDGQVLPAGVAGELCIAGIGVGRGYLGDPARTAEVFVPDPFAAEPGGRLYRSGDIARWRHDGILEYLGRRDHQVKLRGHRIELGEVEAALARQPGVERAVCLVRGGDALVAYVTGAGLGDAAAPSLKAALADALPPYMLPQAIVVLPALPLNPNGKVDRKALPDIELSAVGGTYAAPANATEALLANIWGEVLGLPRVGVHDHFFALGGHSLLAVRAMQKTRRLLQRELPLTLIFRAPTIAAMAAELSVDAPERSPLIALRAGDGDKPPLFCVHPAGGHVASYLPLLQALPADQPVHGLQSRGLHDPQWRNESIEAMARDYAAEIRERQPRGPYQLLGWSMGGTLAMAIAAELEGRGHRVAWVGLIDTVHLRDDEAAVRSDHAAECVDYLEGLLRHDAERVELQALRGELAALDADRQLARAVVWARERGLLPPQMDVADVRLRLESRHESFRLMRGHQPRPVRAPVHLWQAEQTVRESSEAELSWAPFAERLTVYPAVSGDHLDIVRAPVLAVAVTALLHTTNAARSAMEN